MSETGVAAEYVMRAPCRYCREEQGLLTTRGYIERRSGQDCVFCAVCQRHQYNAPRHERGLAPEPVRSSGVSPSTRYRVEERAHFRCEFCGCGVESGKVFHVGHLISEATLHQYAIPVRFRDYLDNYAWLRAECNLGMGDACLPLHDLLIFHIKRILAAERAE